MLFNLLQFLFHKIYEIYDIHVLHFFNLLHSVATVFFSSILCVSFDPEKSVLASVYLYKRLWTICGCEQVGSTYLFVLEVYLGVRDTSASACACACTHVAVVGCGFQLVLSLAGWHVAAG